MEGKGNKNNIRTKVTGRVINQKRQQQERQFQRVIQNQEVEARDQHLNQLDKLRIKKQRQRGGEKNLKSEKLNFIFQDKKGNIKDGRIKQQNGQEALYLKKSGSICQINKFWEQKIFENKDSLLKGEPNQQYFQIPLPLQSKIPKVPSLQKKQFLSPNSPSRILRTNAKPVIPFSASTPKSNQNQREQESEYNPLRGQRGIKGKLIQQKLFQEKVYDEENDSLAEIAKTKK